MNEELESIKARVAWTKQVPTVAVGVVRLCDYMARWEESFEGLRTATEMLTEVVRDVNREIRDALANAEARITAIEERNAAIDLAQLEAVKEKKCCEPS